MQRLSTLILLLFLLPACQGAKSQVSAPASAQPAAVPPSSSAWSGALPFLTAFNQELTFGPGQIAGVFGEGFQPGESVAVSLLHDQKGVLSSKVVKADSLGYVLTVRRIVMSENEKDALPTGHLAFQLSGAAQAQRYGFFVDYGYTPPVRAKGCGGYPQQAAFNGYQVFFCGGLKPGLRYGLSSRQGDLVDSLNTTADPSGLLIFPLIQSSDQLVPGQWLVAIQELPSPESGPVDIGLNEMTVEIIP